MELSAALWILTLIGALGLGIALGVRIAGVRASRRPNTDEKLAARLSAVEADLDEATHARRREVHRSNRLRTERDEALAEIERLKADLYDARERHQRDEDRIAVAQREVDEFRTRFSDIAGIESELASLRVIAARVPELEDEIAELRAAADGNDVIDLRDPQPADNRS